MVNRVLLSPEGLKVSRPGIDVLSASVVDLNFNSDWAHLKTLISGVFSVASGQTVSVPYGITLPSLPLTEIHYLDPASSSTHWQRGWAFERDPQTSYFVASTTQFIVYNGWSSATITVDYRIWEFPQ